MCRWGKLKLKLAQPQVELEAWAERGNSKFTSETLTGSGPADIIGVGMCYLYYRKTNEMEETPNDKDKVKWAWGSVGSCLRDG